MSDIKYDTIPDAVKWSLADWVEWHKALVRRFDRFTKTAKSSRGKIYGNPLADAIFLKAWKRIGTDGKALLDMKKDIMSKEFKYIEEWGNLYMMTGAYFIDTAPYRIDSWNKHIIEPVGEYIGSAILYAKIGLVVGVVLFVGLAGVIIYSKVKGNKPTVIIQK